MRSFPTKKAISLRHKRTMGRQMNRNSPEYLCRRKGQFSHDSHFRKMRNLHRSKVDWKFETEPQKNALNRSETLVDGWLHTGDKGKLDEVGYSYNIGRVKDTFKTAKGEFIVPPKVEDNFSDNNDIEAMCLLGLGMPQPVLILTPSGLGLNKSTTTLEESLKIRSSRLMKR